MEHELTIPQGGRVACGILTCIERSQDTTSPTSSAQMSDPSSSRNPVDSITRMAVYKTGPGGSAAHSDSEEATLLASVTSQQPTVSRVANAVKVDGRLESATTTIRLELFKQQDCRAEFTCEVLAVDALGRELVRTSHLMQQPQAPPPDMAGQKGWTPAVAMHLVDLAQQLNTNMELIMSSMDDYRDRMSGVEAKVATLEKDLTQSMSSQDQGIDDKLRVTENRLEDKFDRLEDKFTHMEDKIESTGLRLINAIDDIKVVDTSLVNTFEALEDKLSHQTVHFSKNDLVLLWNNMSLISNNLAVLEASTKSALEVNYEALKEEIKRGHTFVREDLGLSFIDQIVNSTHNLVLEIGNKLHSLESNIDDEFEELASDVNASAIETRSSIDKSVSIIKVPGANDIASAVKETLVPKTCKKGMVSLLTEPSYPYPVVNPGPGDSLNVPYLCDTISDGGGWILIQRRTTGNVDFYRNWADYKRGFGTLDDDFWLGNDNIHAITSSGEYELRVELRYNGKSAYAHYDKFAVGDESENYVLTLGSYAGTAGDALAVQKSYPFSTFDRDNDGWPNNCAEYYSGAWWYEHCHDSNLNGKWGAGDNKGPRWNHFSSANPVSFSEMKVRRLN